MRVLFVSASPINSEISIGNTFLNVIPEDMNLASIYTKNGFPDKRIQRAFCISEKMIINKLLGKSRCAGKVITERYGENQTMNSKDYFNESIVGFGQKKRYTVMFWVQDILWRINVWKSKELKKFIDNFNPDLIFTLLTNNIFVNRIILHILKISEKPLALYAWDNNYQWNKYQRSPLRWINQYFERIYMRKIVNKAEKIYVISDIQKQDYERIFHKECTVLTKGADFSGKAPIKKVCNHPLQLVYTGNIGSNRWKSLAIIANALEQINHDSIKAQLRIYTATPFTISMEKALNIEGSSFVMGSVPASEVPEIQRNADILVHAEAFDLKNRFLVSHSFSTKIVDYLANASCILAVGPRDIASIDYFVKNNTGLVASSENEVRECLLKIIKEPQLIGKYGKRAYEVGKCNHAIEKIHHLVRNDFERLMNF